MLIPAGSSAQENATPHQAAASGPSLDVEAATRAYLDRQTPERQKARSDAGHYVLHHVYETIVFFAIVLVGGFAFVRASFDWALRRWGGRWSIEGIGDVAGFPLLAALLSVYFFLLTPVLNTYIRVSEAEADLYGLQAAREPDGFAEVALKLGDYRKLEPSPFEEWFFFDHPSGRSRIRMAMQWKAAQQNQRRDASRL